MRKRLFSHFSMLKRFFLGTKILGQTFKKWKTALAISFYIFLLWIINSLGMALDDIFLPKLRKIKVEKPIIILGNPRSGSTFLHRFLIKNNIGTGVELYKSLYPSILVQFLIKSILSSIEKINPLEHHFKEIHDTHLRAMETEEPSFLFRFFDGIFLYAYFLSWAEKDYYIEFDPRYRNTTERDFFWLNNLWKRTIYRSRQTTIIGRLFSPAVQLKTFFEYFPDAIVLYLIRDPIDAIPSCISLVEKVIDQEFGFWVLNKETRIRFINRMYFMMIESYRRFHDDYISGNIPREKIKIIQFPRLMTDFTRVMNEILRILGKKKNKILEKEISRISQKQKKFKSQHKYDLEKYGLNAQQIKTDCAFVYETFFL